jgi:acylphosphatase
MEKGRVHLIISGFVQGVFYRASTREMARGLGLKGWVRNLPDNSVEAVFEGPAEKLTQAVLWCNHGPAGASVAKVSERWGEFKGEFKGFDVRY